MQPQNAELTTRLTSSHAVAIASLTLIVLLARGMSLAGDFLADDYVHIDMAQRILHAGIGEIFTEFQLKSSDLGLVWYTDPSIRISYFRPLSSALFVLDYLVWGVRPFGYHLTNFLLHLCITLGVYLMASDVLGSRRLGWFTGLTVTVHPAATEAVNWVSARTELLTTLFLVIALLCALRFQRCVANGSAGAASSLRSWPAASGWWLLSMAALTGALLSKESAVIFPFLCAVVLYVKTNGDRKLLQRCLPAPLSSILIIAIYFVIRSRYIELVNRFPPSYFTPPTNPRFILEYFFKLMTYMTHYIFLNPVDAFLARPYYQRLWFLGIALFVGAIFLIRKVNRKFLLKNAPMALFLWIPIALAPSALVFLGKRFLYLPLIGFAMYAALIADRMLEQPGILRIKKLQLSYNGLLKTLLSVALIMTWGNDFFAVKHTREIKRYITQINALMPKTQGSIELHCADLWFPMAIGLDHALRLLQHNPAISVHAWSLFYYPTKRKPLVVSAISDTLYRLDFAPYDLLASDVSQFYLWGNPPPTGGVVTRETLSVASFPDSKGRIKSIEVTLSPLPENRRRCIVKFDGTTIVRLDRSTDAND